MRVSVQLRKGVPRDPAIEAQARALGHSLLGGGVHTCAVRVNANRTRILSASRRGAELRVSVHWSVLGATADIEALLRRRDPGARARILAAWHPGPAQAPTPAATPRGCHHHLQPLFDAENAAHFGGRLVVALGWGRRRRLAKPPRSIRLGSFRDAPPRITIHPVLDHPSVPEFMVRSVLFHEMLHAAAPPPLTASGRRILHGPGFRARERSHPDWERARAWERENLPQLLARCAS